MVISRFSKCSFAKHYFCSNFIFILQRDVENDSGINGDFPEFVQTDEEVQNLI